MLDQETFCAYLALQDLADNTIRTYRALFLRWCDWAIAHERDPMRPDPLGVRAWATQLDGTGSYRAQAKATIGHLCAAVGTDDASPAIPVRRSRKARSRALSEERAAALEAHAHRAGLKGLAVLVSLYTAARRSEVACLRWSRLDFANGWITLSRPKNRDLHDVPLHPVQADVLEPRHVPGDLWVFPGRWGGHVSPATIASWVDDVAAQAGVGHVTAHELRHTFGAEVNDTTGDLRATQDLLGHASPDVTAGYTRVRERRLRAAMGSLDYQRPGTEPVQPTLDLDLPSTQEDAR